jgi:hypothetical protein
MLYLEPMSRSKDRTIDWAAGGVGVPPWLEAVNCVDRLDRTSQGVGTMSDLVFIAFDSEQKAEEVREKVLGPRS